MPEQFLRVREAVAKAKPCQKCGGDGFIVTNGSHAEHDPSCDGSCRNCPVEVPDQDVGPCDCVFAQAAITEDEYWRLASALPALLDELEALRTRTCASCEMTKETEPVLRAEIKRLETDKVAIAERHLAAEHELAAERIENTRLRQAFVTMERAYNAAALDLAAARAVLDSACPLLTLMSTEDHAVLSVDRAAWLAWDAERTR